MANVSKTLSESGHLSFTLDSKDNPHIVWRECQSREPKNSDIAYVYWNGSFWSCADGSEYNSIPNHRVNRAFVSHSRGGSHGPIVKVDSYDKPHITWWDENYGSHEVMYVRWDGDDWICTDGSVFNSCNYSKDNPGIVSRNEGDSRFPSMSIDSSDLPHISWCDMSYGEKMELVYVHWDDNNWVCADGSSYDPSDTTVDNPANVSKKIAGSWHPCLVLDSMDHPHIVWQESDSNDPGTYYIRWNGNDWVTMDGIGYDPNCPESNRLANVSRTGTSPTFGYLNIDDNDKPHIGWRDELENASSETMYVNWDGTDWVCVDGSIYNPQNKSINNIADVSKNSGPSGWPDINLDSKGKPIIEWGNSDGETSNCFVIKWDGRRWIPYR